MGKRRTKKDKRIRTVSIEKYNKRLKALKDVDARVKQINSSIDFLITEESTNAVGSKIINIFFRTIENKSAKDFFQDGSWQLQLKEERGPAKGWFKIINPILKPFEIPNPNEIIATTSLLRDVDYQISLISYAYNKLSPTQRKIDLLAKLGKSNNEVLIQLCNEINTISREAYSFELFEIINFSEDGEESIALIPLPEILQLSIDQLSIFYDKIFSKYVQEHEPLSDLINRANSAAILFARGFCNLGSTKSMEELSVDPAIIVHNAFVAKNIKYFLKRKNSNKIKTEDYNILVNIVINREGRISFTLSKEHESHMLLEKFFYGLINLCNDFVTKKSVTKQQQIGIIQKYRENILLKEITKNQVSEDGIKNLITKMMEKLEKLYIEISEQLNRILEQYNWFTSKYPESAVNPQLIKLQASIEDIFREIKSIFNMYEQQKLSIRSVDVFLHFHNKFHNDLFDFIKLNNLYEAVQNNKIAIPTLDLQIEKNAEIIQQGFKGYFELKNGFSFLIREFFKLKEQAISLSILFENAAASITRKSTRKEQFANSLEQVTVSNRKLTRVASFAGRCFTTDDINKIENSSNYFAYIVPTIESKVANLSFKFVGSWRQGGFKFIRHLGLKAKCEIGNIQDEFDVVYEGKVINSETRVLFITLPADQIDDEYTNEHCLVGFMLVKKGLHTPGYIQQVQESLKSKVFKLELPSSTCSHTLQTDEERECLPTITQ